MNSIQTCFQRYEKKYLLTKAQYQTVRFGMAPYMKADAYPRYSISNLYYDTETYDLIRTSLEKPVYKEKLRLRSYGVPKNGDDAFIEIKKKFDGVVYKRRVTMRLPAAMRYLNREQAGDDSQISHEIDYFLHLYRPEPKAFIAYDRKAFAADDGGELRITFDTRLRARSNDLDLRFGDYGTLLLDEDLYLMEIKIPGSAPLWLSRLLSDNGIYPTSFSKYGEYYKRFVIGNHNATVKKEVTLSA